MGFSLYDTSFVPPDQNRISFSGIGPGVTFTCNQNNLATASVSLGIDGGSGSTTWGNFGARSYSYSDNVSGHNIKLRSSQGNKCFGSFLSFSANSISGLFFIPESCTGITSINIQNNKLSGISLPNSAIGMTTITLTTNQINYINIPSGYVNLAALVMTTNRLTGININMGSTSQLNNLTLQSNLITGLFDLSSNFLLLNRLVLDGNNITGLNLKSQWTGMTFFTINVNKVYGIFDIPTGWQILSTCQLSNNLLTGFNMPSLGSLTDFNLSSNYISCSFTIPSCCTGLTSFVISSNRKVMTSPIIQQGANIISTFTMSSCLITGAMIFPPSVTGVQTILCNINNITGFNIPSGSKSITFNNNKITSVVGLDQNWYFTSLVLTNNLLPQSAIDSLLSGARTSYTNNNRIATLSLAGTNNATPSAAGLTDKTFLQGVGWTVTTN